jgi:hypothetical protein
VIPKSGAASGASVTAFAVCAIQQCPVADCLDGMSRPRPIDGTTEGRRTFIDMEHDIC